MRYVFADCILDTRLYTLHRGGTAMRLRPKAFHVLQYLLEHRGHVVSKDELCTHMWPGQFISDATLEGCITLARRAIGDSGRGQRLIQSRRGYGYRFVGVVQEEAITPSAQEATVASQGSAVVRSQTPGEVPQPPLPLQNSGRSVALTPLAARSAVGREAELAYLHRCLDQALTGVRQVVFVTGEAGLGKTPVVEAFLAHLSNQGALWIGRGQCIEQYGAGEAYMPVLEILGRLCRAPGGEALQALLAQQAPTWLVQMPWLLSTADLETLQRRVVGATRERMLREMADAIEVLSASQPLLLVLEDLHWSDYSTLDLLAMLARRQEPARLLLLGTYRLAEVARRDHPLHAVQQELHVHGLCAELPLTFLTEVAIAEYLAARFPGAQFPIALARLVRQRTEGNPLFMVNMLEYWVAQGWLAEVAGRWTLCRDLSELQAGLPASLLQMLETQLNRLSPEEQQVLEAGSVAGVEFSAATVAAGLAANVMQVDERCATLVRRSQFLCARGEQTWPDGTVAGCYGFTHALYHEVLYSRLTAARRVYLHQQIGVRAEAAYGVRAGDIATELALHFEQGRDVWRAVTYLQEAANNAQRRYANREAIDHLTKGLVLLNTLPETTERTQQELLLQCALGASLAAAKGYASPEVERTYARARTLCQQVGETPQLFPVLWGLLQFYMERGELQTARELGERLLRLAQSAQDPALLLAAHNGLGTVLSYLVELLPARAHLEQSSVFYDPHKHHFCAFLYGIDLGADSLAHAAYILWLLGYPEQALRRSDEALTLAQALAHPFSLAHVLDLTAVVHHLRREEHLVQERAEAGRLLSDEHGFAQELGRGLALGGWALVVQGQVEEGLRHLHQGLAAYQATSAQVWQPYYQALLAEAYGKGGQIAEGLRLLTEALTRVDTSGAHWWEAELHRLKGELLLVQAGTQQQVAEAAQCFQQARTIARCQQAKALELRAVMSLSRLWQVQRKHVAAHEILAEMYGWFTEGFDTTDLREAKVLLDELS